MKLTHTTVFLLLTFSLCFFSQYTLAQPQEAWEKRQAAMDWTTVELTLDNADYAATRLAIDKAIRSGASPTSLAARYRLQGKEKYDTQKIFRWAYASYRKYKLKPNANSLLGVGEAMNYNLKPGAYDWVRLRFLVTSLSFMPNADTLVVVGRRLLKIQPKDEEVVFHLVRNLQNSKSLSNRKEAVVLARQWAKKYPRDVYWQWSVASAIGAVDMHDGLPTYAYNEESLAEFREVLRMLPAKHPHRPRVIGNIVRLSLKFDGQGRPAWKKWDRQVYKATLAEALERDKAGLPFSSR